MKRQSRNSFTSQQYISPELASILSGQEEIINILQKNEGVTCKISKVEGDYFVKISGDRPRVFASLKYINKLCPIYSIDEALMFLPTPDLVTSTDGIIRFVPLNEKAELPAFENGHFILDSVIKTMDLDAKDGLDLVRDFNSLSISKSDLDDFKKVIRQNSLLIAEKACKSSCPVNLYTKLGKLTFDLPDDVRKTKSLRFDQVVKPKQRLSSIKSVWACDFLNTSWPKSHLGEFVDLDSKTSKSQISLYLKEKGTPEVYQLRFERKNKSWVRKDIVPSKKKLATFTMLNDAGRMDARTMLCYLPPNAQNMDWLFDFVQIDPVTENITCSHPKYTVNYIRFNETTLYSHKKYDLSLEVNFMRTENSPMICSVEVHDLTRKERFIAKEIGQKTFAQRIELMNLCAYELMQAYTLPFK